MISFLFLAKINKYKERVRKLRELLNRLENGSVPLIETERVDQLLLRAKKYLKEFEGKNVNLNTSLFPAIKQSVEGVELDHRTSWFKLLKKCDYEF